MNKDIIMKNQHYNIGDKNPNYINGNSVSNYCQCGKKILKKNKSCWNCYCKWMQTPKNNSAYKDGRTLKKYFCYCGNEITMGNALYEGGLCIHCANQSINNGFYGKHHSKNFLRKISKLNKGKHHSLKTRKQLKENSIIRWKNEEFRNKTLKASMLGRLLKPNKPEKFLKKLFKKLKFNFKYVGDGKRIVGGFCPDFIDIKDKKIIEFNGTYWHRLPERIKQDKRKVQIYHTLGYKTLTIWDRELKNMVKLVNKLKIFNKE
jgi:very-short-patch-repair endonuclease